MIQPTLRSYKVYIATDLIGFLWVSHGDIPGRWILPSAGPDPGLYRAYIHDYSDLHLARRVISRHLQVSPFLGELLALCIIIDRFP